MIDLLDRDITAALRLTGGTVALHETRGMIDGAHCAGMFMDVGTPSRAFQPADEWRRLRGAMLVVYVSAGPDDLTAATSPPWPTVADPHGLLLHPETPVSPPGGDGGGRGPDAAAMARIAEQSAAQQAAVAVQRPAVPRLGTNPVNNIRNLFAITYADFARLFGITERHAHRWQSQGVPAERRRDTDALQAIGMTIIGGLGPAGARAWLRSGEPSGETLAREGRYTELADRAQAEKDIPFT